MKHTERIKKLLSLLLAAAMCAGLAPVLAANTQDEPAAPVEATAATEAAAAAEASDVWDAIDAFEDAAFASMPALMGDEERTENDYAMLSEQVEQLVTAREDFVEGSLHRNGSFFYWRTTNGDINGYSPYERSLNYLEQAADNQSCEAYVDGEELSGLTGGELVELMAATPTNHDITVINPWLNFYVPETGKTEAFSQYPYNEAKLTAKVTGGSAYHLTGTDATIDAVARAFSNSGIVIIYTHGSTDYGYGPYSAGHLGDQTSRANCSYITLRSEAGITELDKTEAEGEFGTYAHCFKSARHRLCVDGFVIKNHMPTKAPNSLVFALSCLLMSTDKTCGPLLDNGVHTFFGFTQAVYFKGGEEMLGLFFRGLREGKTAGSAFAYMKEKYGYDWDVTDVLFNSYNRTSEMFTYEYALQKHYAFPLLVSPQSPYPGHGNVDKVTTPRSDWMLTPESGRVVKYFVHEIVSQVSTYYPICTRVDGAEPGKLEVVSKPASATYTTFTVSQDDGMMCLRVSTNDSGDIKGGLMEHTWTYKQPDGRVVTYYLKTVLLARPRRLTNWTQRASIPFGKETSIDLETRLPEGANVFAADVESGELPEGMSLYFRFNSAAPALIGTPTKPGEYKAVLRIVNTDGSETRLSLAVTVLPTAEYSTSQNVTVVADGSKQSIELKSGALNSAVTDMKVVDGQIPGMFFSWSMDEAPMLWGTPTVAGTYTVVVRIVRANGGVCMHTMTIRIVGKAETVDHYLIDLTLNSASLTVNEYELTVKPSLEAAAKFGQIRISEKTSLDGAEGLWILVDFDKDGTDDIRIERLQGGYEITKARTSSLGDGKTLKLSAAAIDYLGKNYHDLTYAITGPTAAVPYAEEIEILQLRRYDLYIDGVQVTSANRTNILSNGVFVFDGVQTLTLRGGYTAKQTAKPLIETGMPLSIETKASSQLQASQAVIKSTAALWITGGNSLTIKSENQEGVICTGGRLRLYGTGLTISGVTALRGGGSTILYVSGSDAVLNGRQNAVSGFGSLDLNYCLVELPEHGELRNGSICGADGKPAASVRFSNYNKKFDLTIGGDPVTDRNMYDILGDGTFSYNDDNKTLYVYKSAAYHFAGALVESSINELKICASEPVTLSNDGHVFLFTQRASFTGEPMSLNSKNGAGIAAAGDFSFYLSDVTLNFEGARGLYCTDGRTWLSLYNVSSLIHTTVGAVEGFRSVTVSGTAYEIKTPENAQEKDGAIRSADGEVAKDVEIVCYKTYGLRVNWSLVSENNRADILGDGHLSFDGDHTLTISGDIEVSGETGIDNYIDGLILYVEKDSTITGSYFRPLATWGYDMTITGPGKLTLINTDAEGAGIETAYGCTLTIRDADVTIKAGWGIYGSYEDTLIIDHSRVVIESNNPKADRGGVITSFVDVTLDNVRAVEPESWVFNRGAFYEEEGGSYLKTLHLEPQYQFPLYITGVQVNEDNLTDVLGDGVFSFDGEHTLTVNGACTAAMTDIIRSSVPRLIIDFKPNSKLVLTGYGSAIRLNESAVLRGGPVTIEAYEDHLPVASLSAISVQEEASLTLEWLTMNAKSVYSAITGPSGYIDSNLLIDHSVLTLDSVNEGFAIDYFSGVTFTGCVVEEPFDGGWEMYMDYYRLLNADGSPASHIYIRVIAESTSVVTVTADETEIEYDVQLPDNGRRARIMTARYDADGRFIGVDFQEIIQSGRAAGTVVSEPGAGRYRLFFIDEENAPIHEDMAAE